MVELLTLTVSIRQLPYLVGNVVEILDLDVTAEAVEEGANIDLDATRVGKSAVIKTSTRQTIFLPLIGLVDHEKLKPGDLIGVNKDSYLILDTLPAEYDNRVKAMEVDEKPTEKYTDVGGLDKQIEELVEAVVWPMKESERFKKIGIKAPKGRKRQALARGQHITDIRLRCVDVRPTRHREDTISESLCCSDRSYLPQTCWASASTDVHWRWRETGARLLRSRQRKGPFNYLHRRAGCDWHKTIRQRQVWRSRGTTYYA